MVLGDLHANITNLTSSFSYLTQFNPQTNDDENDVDNAVVNNIFKFDLKKFKTIALRVCLGVCFIILLFFIYAIYVDFIDHQEFYASCKSLPGGKEMDFDPEEEKKMHDKMIEFSKRLLAKQFSGAYSHNRITGKRFASALNAQTFGCMNAKFIVDLDEDLDPVGIFEDGKAYDVLLKFGEESSGSGSWKPKMLSVAMKFYGVGDFKLWSRTTQDFIFQAAYGLPPKPDHFLEMHKHQIESEDKNASWKWLLWHPFLFFNVEFAKLRGTWHTPFNEDLYNSVVAYHWGSKIGAKFFLKPCNGSENLMDINFSENIRYDILKQLAYTDVCFNFFVRYQTDPCLDPIDPVSKYWNHDYLMKVGTVTIPKKTVLHEQDACENFHFNICNGVEAHRPLGVNARAQCAVNEGIFKWRISQNIDLQETTTLEDLPRAMCFNSEEFNDEERQKLL